MHAEFEVSSSNHSRDMEGSQNSKSRSRDPFTICQYGVGGAPIFGILDPDMPIQYATLMGLR